MDGSYTKYYKYYNTKQTTSNIIYTDVQHQEEPKDAVLFVSGSRAWANDAVNILNRELNSQQKRRLVEKLEMNLTLSISEDIDIDRQFVNVMIFFLCHISGEQFLSVLYNLRYLNFIVDTLHYTPPQNLLQTTRSRTTTTSLPSTLEPAPIPQPAPTRPPVPIQEPAPNLNLEINQDDNNSNREEKTPTVCAICQDVHEDPVLLPSCRHVFCECCLNEWKRRSRKCSTCSQIMIGNPIRIYM